MKKIIGIFLSIGMLVTIGAQAGIKVEEKVVRDIEDWDLSAYHPSDFKAESAHNKEKRRIASDKEFFESDVKKELIEFRNELTGQVIFNGVKTGDDLSALLSRYLDEPKFSTLSNDAKYFLAPLYAVRPLKGIIWRVRALFEKKTSSFAFGLGNKATHGQAVQLVRNTVGAVDTFLPEMQWDAGIEFLTQPIGSPINAKTAKATKDPLQFGSVFAFQAFIMKDYIFGLKKAIGIIETLYKNEASTEYVWDNQIGYGKSTFQDGIKRFVGHGKAEKEIVLSALNRMLFEAYVFCAYDQSELINYVGEVGKNFGIQVLTESRTDNNFGMTDEERRTLVEKLAKKGWLTRYTQLNSKGEEVGRTNMTNALTALTESVKNLGLAYDSLQGQAPNTTMLLNPKYFDGATNKDIELAVKNMRAIVKGPFPLISRITGETVTVNLPGFYNDPPISLFDFYASKFEGGKGELEKSGKMYRNYRQGRAIGWDNEKWALLVPDAAGKKADYMESAKRVIKSTKGVSSMFGMLDLFIR